MASQNKAWVDVKSPNNSLSSDALLAKTKRAVMASMQVACFDSDGLPSHAKSPVGANSKPSEEATLV